MIEYRILQANNLLPYYEPAEVKLSAYEVWRNGTQKGDIGKWQRRILMM